MKKIILGILISFLFISSAFATEAPSIFLGLRWGESKDAVYNKMQELGLALSGDVLAAETPFPLEEQWHTGEILGHDGFVGTQFRNGKFVKIATRYFMHKHIADKFALDLSEALVDKYGEQTTKNAVASEFAYLWELENINTMIYLECRSDNHIHYTITLIYGDLEFEREFNEKLNEVPKRTKEELEEERKKELKKQL